MKDPTGEAPAEGPPAEGQKSVLVAPVDGGRGTSWLRRGPDLRGPDLRGPDLRGPDGADLADQRGLAWMGSGLQRLFATLPAIWLAHRHTPEVAAPTAAGSPCGR